MSYDVWLNIKDGLGEDYTVADYNCTSNLSPMWRKAGADIAGWDGHLAEDHVEELELAIYTIEADLPGYRTMNPPNGWGDADGMLADFLRPLHRSMLRWPAATIRVSR